jgi:dynein intermediate chain 1
MFKKERAYKLTPHVEQLAIHFQMDGNLIHKDSEEAKRQLTSKRDAQGNSMRKL